MVAYAQEEMAALDQAPDASTTLFQGCTVTVAQANSAVVRQGMQHVTQAAWGAGLLHERVITAACRLHAGTCSIFGRPCAMFSSYFAPAMPHCQCRAVPQVQGEAPPAGTSHHVGLLPWVVGLQDSVAELRGMLADLGAKHWELQARRQARAWCWRSMVWY